MIGHADAHYIVAALQTASLLTQKLVLFVKRGQGVVPALSDVCPCNESYKFIPVINYGEFPCENKYRRIEGASHDT